MGRAANKRAPRSAGKAAGFSLIEFIGVLTIIALIAAAAGPTYVQRLNYDAKNTEKAALANLSKALLESCVASNQIPNAVNIPSAIAQALNASVSQVTINGRGFTRLFITDPAISINGAGLPYTQVTAGAGSKPSNARAVIVSTIAKALPSVTPTAAEFDAIWNAPADTIPGVFSTWTGRGEDLQIERINFTPLFCKALLKNLDPMPNNIPNRAYYSIENDTAVWVPPGGQVANYYIDGTMLVLFTSSGTTLDTRQVMHGDISFLYQNHKWSRRLEGSDDVAGPFGQLAAEFVKPPAPSNPKFGATQQAVLNAYYTFLASYDNWAYGDTSSVTNRLGTVKSPAVAPYEGSGSAGARNYPNWMILDEARANLNNFTYNLIN